MGKSIIETIERFVMVREDGGPDYQISVHQPDGEHAAGSLPVLFLTDADLIMGTAAELAGVQIGTLSPAILVGIGYGADVATMSRLRNRDMSLPLSDAARGDTIYYDVLAADGVGGAEALLSFLLDTLSDEVARRYPAANMDHRILFGTSLGGLFTTYALFERPDAFRSFLIGSPGNAWDRFSVMQGLQHFADKLSELERQPRVFIGVGGCEEDLPKQAPPGMEVLEFFKQYVGTFQFIKTSYDLARSLRQSGLADVELKVFDGEGHQQVITSLLNRGFRFALSPGND